MAYCHLGGPSQLDYLIFGEFRFWVTFDVGSLDVGSILILGQISFWISFDFGSLDFGSLLILDIF